MSGGFDNQIVGLVRFSYAGKGGYRLAAADQAAQEAFLYDPERLERRFSLFEKLTMPSLLAQTDQQFETIFLTGKALPQPYRQRLEAAVGRLPGGRIVALPPMLHYRATQRAFRTVRRVGCRHMTGFRLDDDDALDCQYIARLRRTTDALIAANATGAVFCTGFNRGLFLQRTEEGNRIYEVVENLPIGLGLAMTVPAGDEQNIFRRNHRRLAQHFSTYTEADTPSFIRTIHADNDSRPSASGLKTQKTDAELADILAGHFPFSLADLRAV